MFTFKIFILVLWKGARKVTKKPWTLIIKFCHIPDGYFKKKLLCKKQALICSRAPAIITADNTGHHSLLMFSLKSKPIKEKKKVCVCVCGMWGAFKSRGLYLLLKIKQPASVL